MNFAFQILKTDQSGARRGILKTPHGELQTPFFQTVATRAAVKAALLSEEVRALGGQILLSNTYHLHLRPGEQVVQALGGLARFEGWDGPTLTDSGGFQVFSLGGTKVTEDGVEFQNHLDGSKLFFTPEKSIQIQNALGADFIMAFDECTPYPCTKVYAKENLVRVTRWAERSQKAHANQAQWLLGIVQGSVYKDLRQESARQLVALDFPAYAIGGLAVGEPAVEMYDMLETVNQILPSAKPRYLMGVGTPENILEAVERGVDFFDCVMPTRNARHGTVFTATGSINLKRAEYIQDEKPIEVDCDCPTCQNFSRGYLNHLIRSGEELGKRLATVHNLRFYFRLMQNIRKSIEASNFASFKADFLKKYQEKC